MPSRLVRATGPGPITAGASSLLVVLVVLVALTTVGGCSPDTPVELNQTRPPVTVTVTTTVTPPPTSTPATSAATSAPTSAPSGPPTSSGTVGGSTPSDRPTGPNASPPASAPGGATQARLVAEYQALIAQVAAIDALPHTGATAGSALDDLAGRYRALRSVPVPAKVDPPSYVGRLFSLELFAAAAAGEARASAPQAAARYDVIRAQTATLLALVNSGLGTSLALPDSGAPPPATPATPTTTPPPPR